MFHDDLAFGKKYEALIPLLIPHEKIEMFEGYVKEYDGCIIQNAKKRFYEVKADRYTAKTGNICIEHICNGLPSGIATTKADIWYYFVVGTNRYYSIPVEFLNWMIETQEYERDLYVAGGKNRCYLFREKKFESFVNTYDESILV